MGYALAIVTAIVTIAGNITAKVWADNNKTSMFAITLAFYIASSIAFPLALKYGKLTVLNAFATVFIFLLTSAAGIFYFKEKLTTFEMIGLGLAFLGVLFLSIEAVLKG